MSFFTWSNGRNGHGLVERRFDRVLYNQNWLTNGKKWIVATLPKLKSDHYPLIFYFNFTFVQIKTQFKFHQMWSLNDSYLSLIHFCWNPPQVGYPMYILNKNLQLLKVRLKL